MSSAADSQPLRLEAARAILAAVGMHRWSVSASGVDGEVLLLSGPEAEEAGLRALGGDLFGPLRAAGFRYVALDLAPREGGDG